jgi:hypothetical protein
MCCIAIFKPKEKIFPFSAFEPMFRANPDGCGMMWAENGEIFILKGHFDYPTFSRLYLINSDKGNIVLHFRTASSGALSFDKCHPFMVNDALAFVENGNLFEFSNYFPGVERFNMTDVQRLNEKILKKLPDNFLKIPEYRTVLESYCANNFTKMLFMNDRGEVEIINEQSGIWDRGIWYSNGGIKNYSGYGFSGAYYYNQGDIRHKGGISNANVFSSEAKKRWRLCSSCLGFYREEKMDRELCIGCRDFKKLIFLTERIIKDESISDGCTVN